MGKDFIQLGVTNESERSNIFSNVTRDFRLAIIKTISLANRCAARNFNRGIDITFNGDTFVFAQNKLTSSFSLVLVRMYTGAP